MSIIPVSPPLLLMTDSLPANAILFALVPAAMFSFTLRTCACVAALLRPCACVDPHVTWLKQHHNKCMMKGIVVFVVFVVFVIVGAFAADVQIVSQV